MLQCDRIRISRQVGANVEEIQASKPVRLDNRLQVNFSPAQCRPFDFLPLIGQASRSYDPIKRNVQTPQEAGLALTSSQQQVRALESCNEFRSRLNSDERGCKPTGVAMTSDGRIVVIDDHNRKVKVFAQSGELEREVCPRGEALPADPWDIAVTHYGNFVITDKNKCVKILDQDGELVTSFGPHLRNPWGVCVNSRGHVIVTDVDHKSVFVHDSTGNLRFEIKSARHRLVFPEYVTTNSNDDVIVSDFYAHAIFVFGALGNFRFRIHSWFPTGSFFNHPCGVASDSRDHIFIADYENARVCEFTAHGHFVRYALTKTDFIRAPQCLVCSPEGATLVLVDGTEVKVFDSSGSGSKLLPPPRRKTTSRSESYRLSIALSDTGAPRLRRKTYAAVPRAPAALPEENESSSESEASESSEERLTESTRSSSISPDDTVDVETQTPKIAPRNHPPISKKPEHLQSKRNIGSRPEAVQQTVEVNNDAADLTDNTSLKSPQHEKLMSEQDSGFTRTGSIRKPLINKLIQQLGIDDSGNESEASSVTSQEVTRANQNRANFSPLNQNSLQIPKVFKDI